MPVSFEVKSASRRYEVCIAEGLFDQRLRRPPADAMFIADEFFAPQIRALQLPAILVPARETSKTLDKVSEAIAQLRAAGLTRQGSIVAVGGGVVQDVAGFIASIFMRGVPWTYIPTTLLAMTDSCIGGKSSINVGKYKNIAGTFYPPTRIEIDPLLCSTLSDEQQVAGLIEAAKICFCRGSAHFDAYLAPAPRPGLDSNPLNELIKLSVLAKAWFVEIDEFDQAERLQLNFGHTFGHAIETASGFEIPHGVAVGLGILTAFALQRGTGVTSPQGSHAERLEDHVQALLAHVPQLEERVGHISLESLIEAFRADKKHDLKSFAVIVPSPSGSACQLTLPRSADTEAQIFAAFTQVLGRNKRKPTNAQPPGAAAALLPAHLRVEEPNLGRD